MAMRAHIAGEYDGVRPYRHGDSLKLVVWKRAAQAQAAGSDELVSRDTLQAHRSQLWLDVQHAGLSDAEARQLFDTNVFGALRVIQAALPLLRAQGSGHIIGVSSVAGIVAGPITGFYNASKFAVEALHESLAQEVKGFGIKVTLLEPGAYATGFASTASLRISPVINAYSDIRADVFAAGARLAFGDPEATVDAVLKVVDSDAPPLRLFVGTEGLPRARAAYADRLAIWEAWETVSNAAQGEARQHNIAS